MLVCICPLNRVFGHFHHLIFRTILIRQAFAAVPSFFKQFQYKHTYLPCKSAWQIPRRCGGSRSYSPMSMIFRKDVVEKSIKKPDHPILPAVTVSYQSGKPVAPLALSRWIVPYRIQREIFRSSFPWCSYQGLSRADMCRLPR